MKNYIYILTTFLLGQLSISCATKSSVQDNYPKDSLVCTSNGIPKDISTLYLPYILQSSDSIIKTNLDTIINEWYSFTLFKFNEPVLSNFYLGHDTYRFLWLRAFHRPVVITLSNDNSIVTLTTKELDGQVHYFELKRCTNCDTTNLKEPKLIINETKKLTLNEWNNFENLLTQCNFWEIPSFKREMGEDGAEWNIEAHLLGKYKFVDRWAPKGSFADCGKYLIKLSGLKEKIY